MRNKSLILFGTLLFSSCLYKAWYNFEGDDLAWMEPYKERDTVVFASSSGMDTMIVNKVTLNNSHPLFVPNEGTSVYNAHGYIESIMFHNKAHYECELTIVKRKDDLMEVYLLFKERALMFVNQNELHLTNVVVNGIEYDDAVIVDDSNSAPGTMLAIVVTISSGANLKDCLNINTIMVKYIRFTRSYHIRERIEQ